MARLEDILKSKGWSDADIAAAAPMLGDARFRASLEESYGALEAERNTFKGRVDEYEEWREKTANPAITAAERDAQTARLDSARLREEIAIAKEYGYLTPENEAAHRAAHPTSGSTASGVPQGFDPKAHKLVTYDDISVLADREGDAIAMASDLAAEYQYLYGKSLFEYTSADGKRGMSALRQEAKQARKNIDAYVAEKFNFNQKRDEQRQSAQKAHDDAIRRETEEKIRLEFASRGNPLLSMPTASRQPFIPTREKDAGMPWDKPAGALKAERLERAYRNIAKESVQ